jgi:transglutaminase-like putative cysteine protease
MKRFSRLWLVDSTEPTALDAIISGLCATLALFAAGLSINNEPLALVMALMGVLGTTVSALAVHYRWAKRVPIIGSIYPLATVAGVLLAWPLNNLMPDNGFPPSLWYAPVICWLIIFGTFTAWRDFSLLFQAVPVMALFGLVGTWGTFGGSVISFFIFLTLLSLLFARANLRRMLAQAQSAGFREMSELTSGPWKRLAGPEMALASAGVVIVVSLLAAPLFQRTVGNVQETVGIRPPGPTQEPAATGSGGTTASSTSIGNGPASLTYNIAFRAGLDQPRYMRTYNYDTLARNRWNRNLSYQTNWREYESDTLMERNWAARFIQDPELLSFQVFPERLPGSLIPTPGEAIYAELDGQQVQPETDGSIPIGSATQQVREARATALLRSPVIPERAATQRDIGNAYRILTDTSEATQRSLEFFRNAAGETGTDYERAMNIRDEIGLQARYNLNVRPISREVNAIDQFLFEDQEGYCDLFASAMVMGARSIGIPARYTIGFYPVAGERDEQGRMVFREAEYHAWAELLFDGVGWVPFDPTEIAIPVPGGERGGVPATQLTFAGWLQQNVDWLIAFAALAFIGFLVAIVIFSKRMRAVPRRRLYRVVDRFEKFLAKHGSSVRHPDESLERYTERITPKLPQPQREPSRSLAAVITALLYGPRGAEPELLDEVESRFRSIISAR